MNRYLVILLAIVGSLFMAGAPIAAELGIPAPAGSQSPRLTASSNGDVLLSWLEPNGETHALRYSRLESNGWTAPVTVATGDNWFVNWADFPSVVPIAGDFWIAHWLVRRPAGGYAYDVYVALSQDGGRTFGPGRVLHDDDTDTEHGFVSIVPEGERARIFWLDGRQTSGGGHGSHGASQPGEEVAGMTLRTALVDAGGNIEDSTVVDDLTCDCCPTAALNLGDTVRVAYRDRTAAEVRDIYISDIRGDSVSPGQPAARDDWHMPACPVNGPAIAANDEQFAVAWFTAADNVARVRLARQHAGTGLSETLTVIPDRAVGRVDLEILDDGSAVMSALLVASGGRADLVLYRIDADGSISEPRVIDRGVPRLSMPQLARAGGDLVLAWTVGDRGAHELRSTRVPIASLPATVSAD